MRKHMIRIAAFLIAYSMPSPAFGDDVPEGGAYGLGDYMTLSLHGAHMTTDALVAAPADASGQPGPVAPATLEGNFGLLRFTVGGYMRATRFRSLVGAELTLGLGWLQNEAIVNDDKALDEMTWGRFFLDTDVGLTLMILERFGLLGFMHARLSVQGGVGYSADMSYVYAGARLATTLVGTLEGEGSYQLRWGNSYAGGDAEEHRLAATLIIPSEKGTGYGLSAEVWQGDQTKTVVDEATMAETVVATPGRAFKGEYRVLMVAFSFRWR